MRLQLVLPEVQPTKIVPPSICPHEGCRGTHFRLHQRVSKLLNDMVYRGVVVERYRCLRCRRTFRVYPQGVSRDQSSSRVKIMAAMLYQLGLSYGATSLALGALGAYMCKSRVYGAVQEIAEKAPGLRRRGIVEGVRISGVGSDIIWVKCKEQWLPLSLMVDDTRGTVFMVDRLPREDAEALRACIEPVAEAVGAEVSVSDA